jgi:iron(III) transport system ATP-binding protein
VGPSGCGKTTLLQAVAGLTPLDAGRIELDGRTVAEAGGTFLPPEQRRVGVVFQDHALFPHLTVADNVEFGLSGRGGPGRRERVAQTKRERVARRNEVLELVQLAHLADRYPHELSGGEQQRVALARALAPRPALVLFDEPFSSLDPNLRGDLRRQTARVLGQDGATAVFVTHDREEALSIGDRVAVLHDGRLEQVDVPQVVFHTPMTRFVANFVGEADLLDGRASDGRARTVVGELELAGPALDGPVEVMVRPHEVVVTPDSTGAAVVRDREFRGGLVQVVLDLDSGERLRADVHHDRAPERGERVAVRVVAGHGLASFPRESRRDEVVRSAANA